MTDPADVFRLTTAAVEPIVDTEPDPQAETPCTEWNYAQLLGHLVRFDQLFLGILGGGPGSPRPVDSSAFPANGQAAPDADAPAPSPRDYRTFSGRLGRLLGDPEVQAGTHELPVGRLPGTQVVLLRSVEHLLHGWDLAKAAGAPTTTLQPIAEALMEPAQRLLAMVGGSRLDERRPFAAPVPVDPAADTLTRFVAAFGRDPDWRPDPVAGYAKLTERFADHADVELPDGSRRGYGADGMRVQNRVFACPHRGRLMIKLPEDEVNALIGAGLGLPLAKPGQRPMREWVLVPFDGAAGRRADRAYAYASR